jgi:hypothetical protein
MTTEERYHNRLEANRRYRQAHKEVLSEKKKIYYLQNRDRILGLQRERNVKECDDLRLYRKTLNDEIAELIASYETRIQELKKLIPPVT